MPPKRNRRAASPPPPPGKPPGGKEANKAAPAAPPPGRSLRPRKQGGGVAPPPAPPPPEPTPPPLSPPPEPPKKKKAKKPAKGKAKKPAKKAAPEPPQNETEKDEGSEDDEEQELESEPEPAPPPKDKGKGKAKKKAPALKKNSNGNHVRFDTDESDGDSDAGPLKKRNKRFNKSRESSDDDDDAETATGGERGRSSKGRHASDDDDDDSDVDWSHFDPDRKPGPSEAPLSLAARRIVKKGMKTYLPLHVFAADVLRAEQNSGSVSLTGTQALKEVDAAVKETEASMLLWTKWNKRHIAALRQYKAVPFIIEMFQRHFDYITNVEGVEGAWHLWRAYDIAMRKKVKGDKPPNIGDFDLKTWSDVLAEAATQQVANGPTSAAPVASSSKQASSSRSRASAPGSSKGQSSKQEGTPLKYDRCMICGAGAHVFDKDKKEQTACKPAWLTWSADKRYHVIRSTGHAVCFAFNSCTKCRRGSCRFAAHGHVCSLCRSADHGACFCTAVAR